VAELEVTRPSPPLTVPENGRHERVDAVPQTASTWRVALESGGPGRPAPRPPNDTPWPPGCLGSVLVHFGSYSWRYISF